MCYRLFFVFLHRTFLSRVNKGNNYNNTTFCSKCLVFLKPFSVNWDWRMLSITMICTWTQSLWVIKCNLCVCLCVCVCVCEWHPEPFMSVWLWAIYSGHPVFSRPLYLEQISSYSYSHSVILLCGPLSDPLWNLILSSNKWTVALVIPFYYTSKCLSQMLIHTVHAV